jgi:hypothetical protein
MSKEQIEEMAKILIDYKNKNHIMASTAILADYAEELYNAGYRKQSDGDGLLLTFDGATGYFPKEFIIEAIKTHMKQSVGGWISVDERLPEECKNVLCFARNKTMIAFMEKAEDCGEYVPVFWDLVAYDRDDTYDEVCATHWMPLPEPPKMKGGAE